MTTLLHPNRERRHNLCTDYFDDFVQQLCVSPQTLRSFLIDS